MTTAERGDLVAKLQAGAPNLQTVIATDRGGAQRADALSLRDACSRRRRNRRRAIPRSMHEPAFILYTSGTTGRAKGVLLTVHGMLWVVGRLLGADHAA